MLNRKIYSRLLLLSAAVALVGSASSALAQSGYEVVYSFAGTTDGNQPYGNLIADASGNLYGTAAFAGSDNCGTAYELSPGGTLTTLYAFGTYNPDGCHPEAGLVMDKQGNLYGATESGVNEPGAVFEIEPGGNETVLHYFSGNDSGTSYAGLLLKGKNLFGTTVNSSGGNGEVFEVNTKFNIETILYSFSGGNDGSGPYDNLTEDKAGNLYGTTNAGGSYSAGVVFKIAPNGTESVLYNFTGGADGSTPYGGLVLDKSGNLYGTTLLGGTSGNGNVFELTPGGTETTLYSFTGGADGSLPLGTLYRDKKGNLYGTTYCDNGACNGAVFEVAPNGTETTLHTFAGGTDGSEPWGGLIEVGGYLYGTTTLGGTSGDGTIFRVQE